MGGTEFEFGVGVRANERSRPSADPLLRQSGCYHRAATGRSRPRRNLALQPSAVLYISTGSWQISRPRVPLLRSFRPVRLPWSPPEIRCSSRHAAEGCDPIPLCARPLRRLLPIRPDVAGLRIIISDANGRGSLQVRGSESDITFWNCHRRSVPFESGGQHRHGPPGNRIRLPLRANTRTLRCLSPGQGIDARQAREGLGVSNRNTERRTGRWSSADAPMCQGRRLHSMTTSRGISFFTSCTVTSWMRALMADNCRYLPNAYDPAGADRETGERGRSEARASVSWPMMEARRR